MVKPISIYSDTEMQFLLPDLEVILKKHLNKKINCFYSGGGLAVSNMDGICYGEHPSFYVALEHLVAFYKTGGLQYYQMYGENGFYKHYLTCQHKSEGILDKLIRI